MALDKLNSLAFLHFYLARFEEVDGQEVLRISHAPYELRESLAFWLARHESHAVHGEGREVYVTRDGWEAFVAWVREALATQIQREFRAPQRRWCTINKFLYNKCLASGISA